MQHAYSVCCAYIADAASIVTEKLGAFRNARRLGPPQWRNRHLGPLESGKGGSPS